jgi:hypothetical protein
MRFDLVSARPETYNLGSVTLLEYLHARPERGLKKRVQERAEVSYETFRRVLHGGRVRDVDVARRISEATDGRVSVWELMQLCASDVRGLKKPRHVAAGRQRS